MRPLLIIYHYLFWSATFRKPHPDDESGAMIIRNRLLLNQEREKGYIGGAERERGEVDGVNPPQPGVDRQMRRAFEDSALYGMEANDECGVFVFDDGYHAAGRHLNAELFAEFTAHGVTGCLARLEFSSGEFPFEVCFGVLTFAAATRQYRAIRVINNAGGYLYEGFAAGRRFGNHIKRLKVIDIAGRTFKYGCGK